jgi:hypothetical protein
MLFYVLWEVFSFAYPPPKFDLDSLQLRRETLSRHTGGRSGLLLAIPIIKNYICGIIFIFQT